MGNWQSKTYEREEFIKEITQALNGPEREATIKACSTLSSKEAYLLNFLDHFVDHGSITEKESVAAGIGRVHFMYINQDNIPALIVHLVLTTSDAVKGALVSHLKAYISYGYQRDRLAKMMVANGVLNLFVSELAKGNSYLKKEIIECSFWLSQYRSNHEAMLSAGMMGVLCDASAFSRHAVAAVENLANYSSLWKEAIKTFVQHLKAACAGYVNNPTSMGDHHKRMLNALAEWSTQESLSENIAEQGGIEVFVSHLQMHDDQILTSMERTLVSLFEKQAKRIVGAIMDQNLNRQGLPVQLKEKVTTYLLQRKKNPVSEIEMKAPWYVDASRIPEGNDKYCIIPATEKDNEFVANIYKRAPVPGFELKTVKVIYNAQFSMLFAGRADLLQERHNSKAFAQHWEEDSKSPQELAHRKEVMSTLESVSYSYEKNPAVKFIPVWHGTNLSILESLFTTGFANLAATDAGFFGKGLYGTTEAEYAQRVYSSGALLVNWVSVFSALPVIAMDEPELAEKGNYRNYDCHFVPVYSPNHPRTKSYHACEYDEKYQYIEVVVFDTAQVLPFYMVELQRSLLQNPDLPIETSVPAPTKVETPTKLQEKHPLDWDIRDVCTWLSTLNLSASYEQICRDNKIDGQVVVKMEEDDWKQLGVTVFGDFRKLGAATMRLKKIKASQQTNK